MHVIVVGGKKDSLAVELREYCEARNILLVEEKFTSTNSDYAAALKELEAWSHEWCGMGSTEAWVRFRGIYERLNSAKAPNYA